MDVAESKRRAALMAECIATLIREYEIDTGLAVVRVRLDHMDTLEGVRAVVGVDVQLPSRESMSKP